MEKFTKGDWYIWGDWAIKCDGVLIAQFEGENFNNAHLIAAAPEMYEMLKELDGYFDSMVGEHSYCESLHDQIIELLAKARGEHANN